jgi:hypothetical protein
MNIPTLRAYVVGRFPIRKRYLRVRDCAFTFSTSIKAVRAKFDTARSKN